MYTKPPSWMELRCPHCGIVSSYSPDGELSVTCVDCSREFRITEDLNGRGPSPSELRRLKDIEQEISRLKRARQRHELYWQILKWLAVTVGAGLVTGLIARWI